MTGPRVKRVLQVETVSERLENCQNDVNYVEHLTLNGTHTLRVYIRNNTYQFQSYGKIERWNGEEWKDVATIAGENLVLRSGLIHVPKHLQRESFAQDRDRLVALAREVLG